jgi:hypothetical protein
MTANTTPNTTLPSNLFWLKNAVIEFEYEGETHTGSVCGIYEGNTYGVYFSRYRGMDKLTVYSNDASFKLLNIISKIYTPKH